MDDREAIAALCSFIDASPSPYHAAANAAQRLEAAGFSALDETRPWGADATGRHFVRRNGSLVAWSVPAALDAAAPWRIIGAHTDSPNLRIKPRPDAGRAGAVQLGVEVYGGPLLNSWLDRDLGLAGRVALRGGLTRLLEIDRPLLRIPQLAIHLDREILTSGLLLNPQAHLSPIWGLGDAPDPDGFRDFIACELDIAASEIVAWDLMTHDLSPASVSGRDGELLAAPRLDNLCSCWAALEAVVAAAQRAEAPTMIALFDHEEVGSGSAEGAAGPLLRNVFERVYGADRESMHRSLAGSVCASADMAHATHPNYPDRHEPDHWIKLNGGPVIKHNASLRYATDAASAAIFLEACERARVPVQHYAHRNDLPCGSTIGPITAARLGIACVDVGAPQLAMHSARETMGSADVAMYRAALSAFLAP